MNVFPLRENLVFVNFYIDASCLVRSSKSKFWRKFDCCLLVMTHRTFILFGVAVKPINCDLVDYYHILFVSAYLVQYTNVLLFTAVYLWPKYTGIELWERPLKTLWCVFQILYFTLFVLESVKCAQYSFARLNILVVLRAEFKAIKFAWQSMSFPPNYLQWQYI